METQLLVSLELLVTIKEGKVVELEPEFWFMRQNCFQRNTSNRLKRELNTSWWTTPEGKARIDRALEQYSSTSSSCPLLARGQRKMCELLGSVPSTKV